MCRSVVAGDPDPKVGSHSKTWKANRRGGQDKALALAFYATEADDTRIVLKNRHLLTRAHEEGGPPEEQLDHLAKRHDEENLRYAKTRVFFSSRMTATPYPRRKDTKETVWPCRYCYQKIRQSPAQGARMVLVDMLNKADDCLLYTSPSPRDRG